MAVRFVTPYSQWINGNSVVEAGAKLYFYTTGTSTPKNTYSDASLTTPNANPVVADSNGKFGDIFLSSGLYKAVLKTSADVTIWTADPIGDSLTDVTITGTFAIDGSLTPSQITADQNNYNPTGLASAVTLRLATDASRNLTGLSGGAAGRIMIVRNVGAFNLVFKDESASSTAANRFALFTDVTLQPDQAMTLQYDNTSQRWFPIAVPATSVFTTDVTITSTDAGAGVAPGIILDRNSASPAANDLLGILYYNGRDSGGGAVTYAEILAQIIDHTDASEDGRLVLATMIAGTLANRAYLGNGFYMEGTSGDPGAGKINALDFQRNGSQLPIQKGFESSEQTITLSTVLTIAHGLGVVPKAMQVVLRCKTTEQGYAVGDEVLVSNDAGSNRSIMIAADATNLYVMTGTTAYQVLNRSTTAVAAITAANWRIMARAYSA